MKHEADRMTDIDRAAFKRLVARMDAADLADLLMQTVPASMLEDVVEMMTAYYGARAQMIAAGRTPLAYGLCLAD